MLFFRQIIIILEYFSDPFLALVQTCLGKEYNVETQAVYQTISHFLIQTLIDGYTGDQIMTP